MDTSKATISLALLFAVICSVYSEEASHSTGLEADDSSSNSHQPQKRSAVLEPSDLDQDVLLTDEGYAPNPYEEVKRQGSLFRFGKRGSLFRFGKRGSLFRFGKRAGSLFRFGKRGGTLFRFGKRSPSSDVESNYDLDLLRSALAQQMYGYPSVDDVASKRGLDSFHWGRETDE